MIRYRVMTASDIPGGLRLCRAAGWNQVEDDWRIFLDASPQGNRVAERDGRVVGTVATLPYGPFTWISMVLVDPAERKHGVGTALLEQALESVAPDVCARLDATPAGQPLYERLGFAGEFEISRMTKTVESRTREKANHSVDLASALARDAEAFGADREFLLRGLQARAPQYARTADTGHSFGRPGFLYSQIGPIIAAEGGAATELASACIDATDKGKVVIDAPRLDGEWLAWLEAQGFREERRLLRMSRGPNPSPGRPGAMYAIAGPELG